jgi:hypothetical protein
MYGAFWLAYPNAMTDPVWPHVADIAAYTANLFNDPAYQRIDGIPLLGVFNATDFSTGNANTNFLAFLAALNQPVFLIGFGGISQTAWTNAHMNTGTSYGINGATPSSVHVSWGVQHSKDVSIIPTAPFARIETINVNRDPRGRYGEPTPYGWSDPPTPPDFETVLITALADYPHTVIVGTYDELDEEGSRMMPTVQDGTSYGIDPIVRVRTGTRPPTITYKRGTSTFDFSLAGSWTHIAAGTAGVTGNYDSNEQQSSNTNDTCLLTLSASIMGSALSAHITPTCQNGPDRGIVRVLKNGVSQGTVDLYSASPTYQVPTITVSGVAGDIIGLQVTGTKNASSSSVLIGTDAFTIELIT